MLREAFVTAAVCRGVYPRLSSAYKLAPFRISSSAHSGESVPFFDDLKPSRPPPLPQTAQ